MKPKRRKHYPMNGPSIELQKLMQFPMRNKLRISRMLKAQAIDRPETLTILHK